MAGKMDFLKIKERRVDLNITQQKLSEYSNISLSTIKSLETGRANINLDKEENIIKFKKLCELLQLDINEVYKEDFRETKIIAIANHKGGCGKSTITGGLSYSLLEIGYKVLMIDSDPQAHLSLNYNIELSSEKNLGKAIENGHDLSDYIVNTEYEGLDIIPSDISMSSLEMSLFNKFGREFLIKNCLENVIQKGIYDFIIFDTNPTLGMVNFNVMVVSDYVIVPVKMTTNDVYGVNGIESFIKGVQQKQFNPNLKLLGYLINGYDVRESVTKATEEDFREDIPDDKIFKTIIRVDTNIKNSQRYQIPVNIYNPDSRISKEFKSLAKEVIKNVI